MPEKTITTAEALGRLHGELAKENVPEHLIHEIVLIAARQLIGENGFQVKA